MTIRPAVVLARLQHLSRVLIELRRLSLLSSKEKAEFVIQLAAERALHVAAEAIFDVGHHVLSGRGLPVPTNYRGIAPGLFEAGILSKESADGLDGLAGLRNLLVHDYGEVDHARLWSMIETRLDALSRVHDELGSIPELNLG
jgi:uncharacterized protein YutE (UPF0331/DUF86 family)